MNILRAEHLGMCFGVRDAIELARKVATRTPLTVLGDLVHNETVLSDLRDRGIRFAPELDGVQTQTVMITAHGASDRLKAEVRRQGHDVMEATCPLVHHAHRSLARLVAEGCFPVIIGQKNHVEVRGMTGDLDAFEVILNLEDIDRVPENPRYGIVAQTTQPVDRVASLVQEMRRRFPRSEVRFIDTVCQPTKQRQQAAIDLARHSDVVVVIGSAHSNNTRELVSTCSRHCSRVHHVQTVEDLHADWFHPEDTIGITAGTSTPAVTIQEIEHWLQQLADQTPSAQHTHSHELAHSLPAQP